MSQKEKESMKRIGLYLDIETIEMLKEISKEIKFTNNMSQTIRYLVRQYEPKRKR